MKNLYREYNLYMSIIPRTGHTKTDKPGAWAVATGSAVWGLFWIPLRYLDDSGITGLWAVALVMLAALLPSLMVSYWKAELHQFRNNSCWFVGCALGLATVLYFIAILYSDVVRVIFLFYLLPLWTTLSARIIYGEPIRRTQLMVIGAALTGVWLLLGGGTNLPLPRNIGDWCAIGAGLCWGVSLSLLRGHENTPPFVTTSTTLAAGQILSIVGACAIQLIDADAEYAYKTPDYNTWIAAMPYALAFGILILYPAMLGQIWGARRIPAPTAALLTMTEIIVATVSAGILIGTELKPIALLGGLIIIIAVCIDLARQRRDHQRTII